jgi:hypothetical protein
MDRECPYLPPPPGQADHSINPHWRLRHICENEGCERCPGRILERCCILDATRKVLDGLKEGSALSVSGALHVEAYSWECKARFNLKLTADQVLALKPKPKAARKSPVSTPDGADNETSADMGGANVDDDLPI